jgi:hypothetical protein
MFQDLEQNEHCDCLRLVFSNTKWQSFFFLIKNFAGKFIFYPKLN